MFYGYFLRKGDSEIVVYLSKYSWDVFLINCYVFVEYNYYFFCKKEIFFNCGIFVEWEEFFFEFFLIVVSVESVLEGL